MLKCWLFEIMAREASEIQTPGKIRVNQVWSFEKNAVKGIVPKNPRRMAVCKAIAETIKAHIEPEKENESLPELKIKGLGVSDYQF